ncbi:MAG: glycosyltransferase family 2 protein, partial [Chloroflexota bacterium]
MTAPLASVIILTWNGCQDIEACLQAVQAQTYASFEVLVVDNASTDQTVDFVAEHFSGVVLIQNQENLGFSAGNNVGLRQAKGDILVLLNQDTVVEPDWLAQLVEAFQHDTQIGIVGGKAYYPDGLLQHAGGQVGPDGSGSHIGDGETDQGQYDRATDVDYITGATLAISRTAYKAVGGLDEGFSPAYHEDVDWCYRVRQAGFRVVYQPKARLIHKEQSKLATPTHDGMYVPHRNRLRFVLKHWTMTQLTNDFLPKEQAWLTQTGEGQEQITTVMAHVYLFHLLHLNTIIKDRENIHPNALDQTNTILDILLSLRKMVTIDHIQQKAFTSATADDASTDLLQRLHQNWVIEAFEFQSTVPVLGRFITLFRQGWYRVAAAWGVRSVMQQQTQINGQLLTLLDAQNERIARLERHRDALVNYILENNREVTDLAQILNKKTPSATGPLPNPPPKF